MIPALACFGLSLTSCSQSYDRQPDTRQAGREAYRASQELKKDAKRAAQDLRNAGKNFREGWNDAQREDRTRRREPPPPPPRDRSDR